MRGRENPSTNFLAYFGGKKVPRIIARGVELPMDVGTLLATVAGGSIALIGTGWTVWNARKTAQITAENAARMQSDKLKHDAGLGERAFRRGKLEELCLSVERATANYTLSTAVLHRPTAPTLGRTLPCFDGKPLR